MLWGNYPSEPFLGNHHIGTIWIWRPVLLLCPVLAFFLPLLLLLPALAFPSFYAVGSAKHLILILGQWCPCHTWFVSLLAAQLSAYYLQSVDGTSGLSQVIYPNQDELCAPFSIVCLFHWYAYFPIKAFGSTYTFPATTALKEKQLPSLLEHWVSLVLLYYLHMWSIPQYRHYAFCSFNSFLGDSWISSALPGWWLKTLWPPLLGNLEKLMQICSSLWIWWRWQTLDCGDMRRHPPTHMHAHTHTTTHTHVHKQHKKQNVPKTRKFCS